MMNQNTGTWLSERSHIHQSINDIVHTRIGTRIQREEYGSIASDIIDQPQNEELRLLLSSGIIMAIATWEPRIVVQGVCIVHDGLLQGGAKLSIEYEINGRADVFEKDLFA
jgi:phage baseplate assembly protein W